MLVFHDPADAATFDGAARTALFGHLHYRRVKQGAQGTWLMVQGSTGGSGLRALEPDPDPAADHAVGAVRRPEHPRAARLR